MSYESMKEMLIDIVTDFGAFECFGFNRPLRVKKQPRNCNYPPIRGIAVHLDEHETPQIRAFGWDEDFAWDTNYESLYEVDIRDLSFTDRVRIMRRAFREVEKIVHDL